MRIRIAIAVVVLISLAAPAYAQTSPELTQDDVDAALTLRRSAGSDLEALTARFDQAIFDEEILRERILELSRQVVELEQDIVERRTKVADLVVSRYMAGGPTGTERVFNTRAFTDLPVQDEYLRLLNAVDLAVLDGLEASEELQVRQQDSLVASLTGQRELVGILTGMATELSAALAAADAEYNGVAAAFTKQEEERKAREEAERKAREAAERKKAEAARKTREAAVAASAPTTTEAPPTTTTEMPHETATTTTEAPPETTTTMEAPHETVTATTQAPPDATTVTTTETTETTSGDASTTTGAPPDSITTTTAPPPPAQVTTESKTCPVNAANSFSDTWGAARSGGRSHKGVDIFATRNAPLVAIESGTVTRTSNSSLGGISIYLTGSSGNRYYYAHLEDIAAGITGGTKVSVGDVLGGVGTSGNAPAWLPMLHFQYAPPGSTWVNPYPLAEALCG